MLESARILLEAARRGAQPGRNGLIKSRCRRPSGAYWSLAAAISGLSWQARWWGLIAVMLCGVGTLFAGANTPTNAIMAGPAVYVPDTVHQNDAMPDGVFAWDGLMKDATVAADAGIANFSFSFTNVSPGQVAVLDVHPSCGCTTAHVPTMPWIIPAGGVGQFGLTVNVAGRTGELIKTVTVRTEKGMKQLYLKIHVLPPVLPRQSDADREHAVQVARADRQAIFRGDCVSCHVKPGQGKYGKPLYDADCGICHDSHLRASFVPDLHHVKAQTNVEYWRTWTAHGKAGSLMPAFATSDGGPLSDIQISSLVQYLAAGYQSQSAENK